jgi:hypothetical protein
MLEAPNTQARRIRSTSTTSPGESTTTPVRLLRREAGDSTSRPNAKAMGFTDQDGQPLITWRNPEEVFDAWASITAGRPVDYTGLSYEKLRGASGIPWPVNGEHPEGTDRLYGDRVFPTDSDYCETYGHNLLTGGTVTEQEHRAMAPAGARSSRERPTPRRTRRQARPTPCCTPPAARSTSSTPARRPGGPGRSTGQPPTPGWSSPPSTRISSASLRATGCEWSHHAEPSRSRHGSDG